MKWMACLLLLSACTGHIDGDVFLDSNANGVPDKNEKFLTNLTVKMTQDGQPLNTFKTDGKGHFSTPIKKPGYYCLQVAEPALQENLMAQLASGAIPISAAPSVNQNIGVWSPPPAPSPRVGKQAGVTPALGVPSGFTATAGDRVVNLKWSTVSGATGYKIYWNTSVPVNATTGNLIPVNSSTTSSYSHPSLSNGTTYHYVIAATSGAGDGTLSNEASATPSATSTATTPASPATSPDKVVSGMVCQNVSGLNLTTHIPVTFDYQADLNSMPDRMKQSWKTGDTFSLGIPYPIGCVLKSLFLPDGLEFDSNDMDPGIRNVDDNVGRIDFKDAALSGSVKLNLRVKEDLPLGKYSVTLSPEAICPDGKKLELNPITIEITSLPHLYVSQSILKGDPGATVPWRVTLENSGSNNYEHVTLTATPPHQYVALANADPRCEGAGDKIECHVNVAANSSEVVEMQMLLTAPTELTHLAFQASAKLEDQSDVISGEDVGFDLIPAAPAAPPAPPP
ncbi:MAG: SdrD B-like domain-containing protein [Deltaproteobacteria bacterium]|nr:SdrD B-like domain-containing protein [Deltaproteobacteria bacterium]